jgi:hypothetical protein
MEREVIELECDINTGMWRKMEKGVRWRRE